MSRSWTAGPVERDLRRALWILLGGGLDDAGKEKWLAAMLDEGMTAEEIFAEAIRMMEGQIAT